MIDKVRCSKCDSNMYVYATEGGMMMPPHIVTRTYWQCPNCRTVYVMNGYETQTDEIHHDLSEYAE